MSHFSLQRAALREEKSKRNMLEGVSLSLIHQSSQKHLERRAANV